MSQAFRLISRLSVLPLILLLSSCNMVVMAPSGFIALQQRNLIVISVVLMLLIIIPVIFLIFLFAWRYRASNTAATYDPDWHHSTRLEVIIWSAPLAIIIALGAVTWISTHELDPYRPLDRISATQPVETDTVPLTVEVVALDWKWLFFYPELGIATVNELAAPVNTPINFKITALSVMNSFYVPALAGQIYAMPGMETKLHAVINHPGEFEGFSANYSGPGFSKMRFHFHGLERDGFDKWVEKVKASGQALDRSTYLQLEKPSIGEPVHYYASFEDKLYSDILNLCTIPGKMCLDEMMHIDDMGGAGKDSEANRARLVYDVSPIDQFGSPNSLAATTPATGQPAREAQPPQGATGVHQMHDMNNMDMNNMNNGTDPAPAQLNNNK